jgi:hypothetical protein
MAGLVEDMDKPYGHDETVGWQFGEREFETIRADITGRRPLLATETVWFYLLAFATTTHHRPRTLLIIDPILQGQLRAPQDIRQSDSFPGRALTAIKQRLAARILGETHVLMPLVGDNHWSLLFYHATRRRWYHYDSLAQAQYHLNYACGILNIIASLEGHAEARDSIPLVRQECASALTRPLGQAEGWECGFFVIMYAQGILYGGCQPLLALPAERRCASLAHLVPLRHILMSILVLAQRATPPGPHADT